MHYDWLVINCESLTDAQAQLNNLDQQNYEVYATHMFTNGATSYLARKAKKKEDIRY